MSSLKDALDNYLSTFNKNDKKSEILKRAAQVNLVWKNAVIAVYGISTPLVLQHINAVYILSAHQVTKERINTVLEPKETVLVVYCDDTLIRSDLDARQEFLKMKLREQGENVGAFVIKHSRFDMKERHPYQDISLELENNPALISNQLNKKNTLSSVELSQSESTYVEEECKKINNENLRNSVERAMISAIKRKKIDKGKNDSKL